ncbi:MAG: hypothetical protein ACYTG2_04100 [Planctomycetota bacterium]|jgi:hypothetical protein
MTHRELACLLCCLLLAAAGCGRGRLSDARALPADGELQVHGALRAMMHEGRTGAVVSLDTLLPDPELVAVGALAELAGEITIVRGTASLSFPDGDDAVRTETSERSDAGAALLVAARVPAWRRVVTERPIPFEELDARIAELAGTLGSGPGQRFPFLLEGTFEQLRWHVIDGRRLDAGASSHEDHVAAAVITSAERTPATLVGFYSESDGGIFTHMGARTHVHCIIDEPVSSGHVDHVVVPAGTTLSVPAVSRP